MTQPNDSIVVADKAGGQSALPTHLRSGKELEVTERQTYGGHLIGSAHTSLVVALPAQTAGIAFDVFNGSDMTLLIAQMFLSVIGDTAQASPPTTGTRFPYFRTSAPGTGGTAFALNDGVNPSGIGLSARKDTMHPIMDQRVSARINPTGGATASSFLGYIFSRHVYNNDDAMMTQFLPMPGRARGRRVDGGQPWLEVNPNEGFRVDFTTAPANMALTWFNLHTSLR